MRKNTTEFLQTLRAHVDQAGSQKAAAANLKMAESYLCDVLKDRKRISKRVAKKLGFEWQLVKVGS